MELHLSDKIMRQAGLTEHEALVEFACRLFQAGKLSLQDAERLADMSRGRFEDALLERGIPIYKPTVESLRQDLESIEKLSG